eukprot:6035836-Prymnesium_polylepis.1
MAVRRVVVVEAGGAPASEREGEDIVRREEGLHVAPERGDVAAGALDEQHARPARVAAFEVVDSRTRPPNRWHGGPSLLPKFAG